MDSKVKNSNIEVLGCLLLQGCVYLDVFREITCIELRINLRAVDEDLKAAVVIGCERELMNPLFILRE